MTSFYLVSTLLLLAYLTVVLRNAWVCDDTYITLRTVDNFVNGYGLRWNIAERVEVYTHPLWMFLLSAFYFFTREAFLTSLIPCILISLAAFYILLFRASVSLFTSVLASILLILSKSFIDYSTSGLENSLSFLLIAIYFLLLLRQEGGSEIARRITAVTAIFALILLNRMDLMLIILPSYVYFLVNAARDNGLPAKKILYCLLIGLSPFLIWKVFAIIYYGFLFPNSAYAKLNTGISAGSYIRQGLIYYIHLVNTEPVTVLATAWITLVFVLKKGMYRYFSVGIILYSIYVLSVGGDFMSGRLLTVPLFLSVLMISRKRLELKTFAVSSALFLFIGGTSPYNPVLVTEGYEGYGVAKNGIADEKGYYFKESSLLQLDRSGKLPYNPRAKLGSQARGDKDTPPKKVVERHSAGIFSWNAGPEVHVIDGLGIGDPLLSKLPAADQENWRIGHFIRPVPKGYTTTLITGKEQIEDKGVAEYYRKLHLVISGDIFDTKRFYEIVRFNVGANEGLLDDFREKVLKGESEKEEDLSPKSYAPVNIPAKSMDSKVLKGESEKEEDLSPKSYAPVNIPAKSMDSPEAIWELADSLTRPLNKIRYFNDLAALYPDHELAPKAILMVGYIYLQDLKRKKAAIATFEKLIEKYPESESAEVARQIIEVW